MLCVCVCRFVAPLDFADGNTSHPAPGASSASSTTTPSPCGSHQHGKTYVYVYVYVYVQACPDVLYNVNNMYVRLVYVDLNGMYVCVFVFSGLSVEDSFEEMTMNEIFHGKDAYFPGTQLWDFMCPCFTTVLTRYLTV